MSTTPNEGPVGPGEACSACRGAGEVWQAPADPASEDVAPCPMCGGTGKHPEPVEVEPGPQDEPATAVPTSLADADPWGKP